MREEIAQNFRMSVHRRREFAQFRQFADSLPIGVWMQEPTGSIAFTNGTWSKITNLSSDASPDVSEAWRSIVHPNDFDRVLGAITTAVNEPSDFAFEFRVRPRDRDDIPYRWYYASAMAQSIDGVFSGWLGSIVDIEETRIRENELRAFAESIPQIAWITDASGSLEWYNQRWYDYTGQTVEEAAGWGWQAVQHPDDFQGMLRDWTHALETGEPAKMEFRLRGRDGRFRWFLTLVHPLKDENGHVVRWFGTNTDIHEHKQYLERTKRLAQTLQEVFLPEHLPKLDIALFDATYMAAESDAFVGGDWYDAFTLENGNIVVSIGDVAGHGLDAAVTAGRMRQTIFSEILNNDDPATVLIKADRALRAQTETTATAFLGLIDVTTGNFCYASAGHPAPILAGPREACALLPVAAGSPLGTGFASGGLRVKTERYALADDSLLLLYTDGITELTRDLVRGEADLISAVDAFFRGGKPFGSRDISTAIIGDATTVDDVALLLVRWKPALVTGPIDGDAPLTKHWRFHSSHARSARASRHELMTFVKKHASDREALFSTEIILGELLANTVEHAPGMVEISIDWTGTSPVLTIRDAGAGFKADDPSLPASDLSEDGRGLYLIRALSLELRIRNVAFGSEIEVVLPVTRARSN